jgi:hypothetical protein
MEMLKKIGRPFEGRIGHIGVTVPMELRERVMKYALQHDTLVTRIVEEAVTVWLDKQDKKAARA